MKKILGIIAITFIVLLFVACGGNSITIVNRTGYTIYSAYVSHDSSTDWEEDVLGSSILVNGEKLKISLPRGGLWDIMLIDTDGDSYTRYGVRSKSEAVFTIGDLDD